MIVIIQAVLRSKSLGYEYSEDILTSTVFGTLKYLDKNNALIAFIENDFQYDENRTTLWERLKEKDIELRCYQELEYIFWANHPKYGEPDLMLLFSNHVYGCDDLLLIIEAKFKSGKSGINENDQLARYFDAVYKDIENFSDDAISNFKGKKGYVIYLTELEACSEISASSLIIQTKHNGMRERVFHLRWHQLYQIFEKRYSSYSYYEKLIVNDLMRYLEKLGLRDFSGFSLPEESLDLVFNSPHRIFYNDPSHKSTIGAYFDLADINLSYDHVIFYEEENSADV